MVNKDEARELCIRERELQLEYGLSIRESEDRVFPMTAGSG